jgi:G3E family GTPase
MTYTHLPVTILTGFLGAGKTTLLNALLTQQTDQKLAVIVNEFGDVGLDDALIVAGSEEVVLMPSGCLCCTLREDLSTTLCDLLARRAQGALEFDRLLIETTGLAEPAPILQTLLRDRRLAQQVALDGVVTLADAQHGPQTLDQHFEAVSQVALADLVVISKADLVTPKALSAFQDRLRGLNPTARIVQSVSGTGIGDHLWGQHALRPGTMPDDVLAWTTPKAAPNALFDTFTPAHTDRIASASITLDTPIDDAVFDRWLDVLIALRGSDILRVKGVVFLKGMQDPFVFHGVQHTFDPPIPVPDWPTEDRRSRIVVIARNMTQNELDHSLNMLRGQIRG